MTAAATSIPGELIYQAIGLQKQFDNGKVLALRGLDLEIRGPERTGNKQQKNRPGRPEIYVSG